jgi:hypothetical protein
MLPRWWVAWLLRRLLFRTTMIAITGSNGKTTATRYLAAILSAEAPTEWTRLNRNNLLPRVFFSLIGEVRCRINNCKRPMVCDDCPEFGNPELVQRVRDELTVRVV